MPSSKEYLNFILEQLSGLQEITYKPMMGEFLIYYQGKIVGGIYDNRFLVKAMGEAKKRMPNARLVAPYKGAKEMLLIEEVDDRDFLTDLFKTVYEELPLPSKRR